MTQDRAKANLWLHFTRMSSYESGEVPVIVRGSGQYVFDQNGKRYLDGLSGLFVSQIGHGRKEVAEAGARQGSELAYSRCGRTRIRARSSWRSGSPSWPPAT
jgi:adenosylmethionine-8-amino-7-oxononanoate aminotransferase